MLRYLKPHPTLINLVDYFETTNQTFLVFELAPYGELFELLSERVFVSEAIARHYMKQILTGVAHLHDQGKNIFPAICLCV